MKRFLNWITNFFKKHFVKHEVHWVQSILIIPLTHDGKMVLHIERTSKDGLLTKGITKSSICWMKTCRLRSRH